MREHRLKLLATTLAAALLLAACGGADDGDPSPATTNRTATETAPPAGPAAETSVEIPDTPAGEMTAFLIALTEQNEDVTPADFGDRLSETLLAAASAQEIADVMNSMIRPARPFVVTDYQGDETTAVATMAGTVGSPFLLQIAVDDDGRLTGIYYSPAPADHEPATSIEDAAERLSEMPVAVRALVTLTEPGEEPTTLISQDPGEAAPLASAFKLYVLLAVHHAVEEGELTWDEELVITDEIRSIPAGELAEDAVQVSVRDAAGVMISASDNTATDVLINRLGREAVEDAVVAAGHHDPALLRPFLTTRELFEVAWGEGDLAPRWADSDEPGRRAILDEISGQPLTATTSDVTGDPVWDDGLDWFASPSDIDAVLDALEATGDPTVREILSTNPGIGLDFDRDAWPHIEFKGGGSLGVTTGAWRAERADGAELRVIVLTSSDDTVTGAENQGETFGLVEDIFRVAASL
ncbi:MAG TPA: Cpe/LpqF family protein [Actinomycetaceae bacterium]|nr:Cpe/LpqF family protein [Actinomycetaceae bacterium]